MPSVSEKQRKMMGAALGRKREGKSRPSDPQMNTQQLEDFATPPKGKQLPVTVKSHGRHSPEKKKKGPRHASQTMKYVG